MGYGWLSVVFVLAIGYVLGVKYPGLAARVGISG